MKIALLLPLTVSALLLCGCGQVADIGGQAASAAASAAASEVGRQAGEAVDGAVGPVCQGLTRADKSLSALAQGKAETVAEAKKQIADAQADLDAGAAESIATQAVLAGVTTALDGLSESLAPLGDEAVVPESVATTATTITDTIDKAQSSLGC